MSLTLHFHPLSSFCQKAVIGLYELDVPFAKKVVALGDAEQRAAFLNLWPMGKFPVLVDEARKLAIPESSVLLEYVDRQRLVPADVERARDVRLRDRFFDLYVNVPMGKIVTDQLRPEGKRDPLGVEQAKAQLETAYAIADAWLGEGRWAAGDTFTLADCAAAPALFFAQRVVPVEKHANVARYFARLAEHASVKRTFDEAKPYLAMFPG